MTSDKSTCVFLASPRSAFWMLAAFAVTMTIAHGVKVPLGYGVFTALGGALLLGAVTDIRLWAEREPNMSNQSAQEAGR